MPGVIRRIRTFVNKRGFVVNVERPESWEVAERVAGCRLDRRRCYAIIKGEVRVETRWTQACSGCYEGNDTARGIGSGCRECGGKGRVRCGFWAPLSAVNQEAL